jgi:hypothetical protein
VRRLKIVVVIFGLTFWGVAGQERAEFPFAGGVGRLRVRVNGQGPFPFGFDTGASGIGWVSRALMTRLQLPKAGGFRLSDGSTSMSSEGVQIASLELGPVRVERAVVPVLNNGACDVEGESVCGTLGLDAFRGFSFTLDYPGKKIVVSRQSLAADGADVVRYMPQHGSPRVEIGIAGVVFTAWVDSGNRGTMLLPMALAKELPLVGELAPAGKIGTVVKEYALFKARLAGDVTVGAVRIERPEVYFTEMVKEPNLGRGLLQNLVTTFDTVGERVRFARPSLEK